MINSTTQKQLNAFLEKPSSTLLIEGGRDFGSEEMLKILQIKLLGETYKHNTIAIQPDEKGTIGIAVVRDLIASLAKIAGREQTITRMVVISEAEKLTEEAQNALLKLLEEPTKNTLLVLVVADRSRLMDTVRSRCQFIKLLPITLKQANEYCEENAIPSGVCERAFLLSGGAAVLFRSIATDTENDTSLAVKKAKEFLSMSIFDRLSKQKEHADKEAFGDLLRGLAKVTEAGLHNRNNQTSKLWQQKVEEIRACKKLLEARASTKLLYTRLSLVV